MSQAVLPARLFVDAAVFMYVAGGEHPYKAPCAVALRRAAEDGVELVTDSEVLQEILHRYFSIGRAATAEAVFRGVTSVCREVLPIQWSTLRLTLAILLQASALSPRDAIHVAVMRESGLDSILTTDRDFDAIEGIIRIDPCDVA